MVWLVPAGIGLLAGVVGGLLGVGGSLIIIPAMVFYLSYGTSAYTGQTQHMLQAAAMICNVFVAAPAVLAHRRAGAIMGHVVAVLVPVAIAANLLGVAVSNSSWFARENGTYLAMILAGFLVYVVGYNIRRLVGTSDLATDFDPAQRVGKLRAGAVGAAMGFTGGLLGIGGGAICVPLQQVLLKIPLRRAIANSATTIVFAAAIGAVMKNATLPEHGVPITDSLKLAAALIPTAILGSYLGGRLTHRLPRNALRVVFIVFMLVVAARLFYDAWQAA